MSSEFSKLTIEITSQLSKSIKKEQGIFITPKTIITKLYDKVKQATADTIIKDVLEPSCGTCEIVKYLDSQLTGATIDAIEQNETIFGRISKEITCTNNALTIIKQDFTTYTTNKQYDLIMGNPPFFVIPKESIPENYEEYMIGRPNIFGLFIVHSMSMLKENGILAFIVPKSFLNSSYYSKIRNYMKSTGKIVNIIDFEKDGGFIDTHQSTFGFIFQKLGRVDVIDECPFSIKFGENFMFSDDANSLRTMLDGSTTLSKLGLSVKTGNVVWNQRKPLLTSTATSTLLLYNSNITNENTIKILDFANDEKKQYINMDGVNDIVIVVNRGNGNSAYKLNYALVDGSFKYLAENHLNVIYSDRLIGNERKKMFDQIITSFKNPKTEQFTRTFLGNNGLSKTELETVFPIYL